jgi:hypothetical protein
LEREFPTVEFERLLIANLREEDRDAAV